MDTISPVTQYSIYRIDFERADEVLNLQAYKNEDQHIDCIISGILDIVTSKVASRRNSSAERVRYFDFEGVFFKTIHEPAWKGIAMLMIRGNEREQGSSDIHRGLLDNINASYVLLYRNRKSIYALTGGFGSHYITQFVERNFGMYLLPKALNSNEPVLRQILQSNLTGNLLSSSRANRYATNFNVEKDMSGIFRELDVEVDPEIAAEFGIYLGEGERRRKIHIISKDSIIIRRNLTVSELILAIQKIDSLYTRIDRFALNYLVPAKKRDYKNAELLDALCSEFASGHYGKFEIVADNLTKYLVDGRNYLIKDDVGNEQLSTQEPIDVGTLFNFLETLDGINRNEPFFARFLKKWSLTVIDANAIKIIDEMSIFSAIQGYIEFGETREPIYLYNGSWYVFDQKYADTLNAEFLTFYNENERKNAAILQKFALIKAAENEETYNSAQKNNTSILVTHCVKVCNVEIADAIFWDEQNVYFLHNKGRFIGEGARDVTNQIITSAEFMQKSLFSLERVPTLIEYYQKIVNAENKYGSTISSSEFVDLFSNRNIFYIAGYLENYNQNSLSTYAKFLTIETEKRLIAKGYKFTSLSLTGM